MYICFRIQSLIMSEMEIKTKGYAVLEKTVRSSGNAGGIYLPKEWIGKVVKVILIDPP